ncbi:hypothetical protein GQ55_4G133600 [Panicum hallii var. hallii]|uniref:Uncharacterized protein n=1 Tax=Panicum hallii var. hallii TaxID=1504633 RepID=A0A2T7DY56_9POAL|nr:hypothetical protein GQ55_4G133600 [Panicum hallii var. hallii]
MWSVAPVLRHHPSVLSSPEPSARQGGGEPLLPVPLEVARCLCVLEAELAPPPPPVRREPGRVVAVDSPWPSGQTCHNCGKHHPVPACARPTAPPWAPPRAPSSARPRDPAWAPTCALRGLPRLRPSVVEEDSPFFPSPRQTSHCFPAKWSLPPMVTGSEESCGSSVSTTLRRPIASSIDIVERSTGDSTERTICLYFGGAQRKSFSIALSSS